MGLERGDVGAMMKKAYEKPSLVRRDRLGGIAANIKLVTLFFQNEA
jgi:hypothetical protein